MKDDVTKEDIEFAQRHYRLEDRLDPVGGMWAMVGEGIVWAACLAIIFGAVMWVGYA